jgi:TP901 family phage tail tape measure protein
MADVQSNIHVNIDTSDALASLKLLQRQISAFHTQMAKSGTAASAVAANQAQNLMNSINATGQFQASMRTVTSSTESFTDALEKNKLTSREYFRYTGAATKTFGRLFRSEFETINKVARERVKDIQTQYIKMGRGANGALQAIAVRPLALDMKDLGTQTAMAAQKQQILNQLLKQGSTNLLNFGKNTQWAGRQLMVGFTVPLVMLGSAAAKTFMAMEEQAIRFKRVYGELFTTAEETDAMVKDIQRLAKEYTKYGVAVEETMKMAADAAAMGKMGADLTAQVAQATRLAVLGGVEQAQALETTISVTNAFGVATEDLAKKIDFLNAVENQTVVSIEDLTIAIPKAGPVVQQLGGNVEDLAFFLTAMKEGGINASEGANALKSGLASLINPSEKASKFLAGLGVNIKGIVEGNAGDVKSTVIEFSQALDTLDPLNRARAIEQLFGKFQFSRLSTLFQNVTAEGTQAARVLGLTKATTEELAILSERELSKIENTTTYKFKKSIEDLKVTLAPVGEQFLKALTPIVEFAAKILDKFNDLGDGSKKFLTILTVALGAVGPVALMAFGLLANGVANIIKMFAGLKGVFNRAGSSTKELGQQTDYLTQQQLEASSVAASLDQVHQRLRQTFTSEATAVNALATAYKRAIAAQLGFTGPAPKAPGVKGLKKYSTGTGSVPGTGNSDTVHALLTPGEAVIPKQAAQDPNNRPIIEAMINQNSQEVQSVIAAKAATDAAQRSTRMDRPTQKSHIGTGKEVPISEILKSPNLTELNKNKLIAFDSILGALGLPKTTTVHHSLMYEFDKNYNRAMAGKGIPVADFLEEWKRLPDKFSASNISMFDAAKIDQLMYDIIKEEKFNLDPDGKPKLGPDGKPIVSLVNDDYIEKTFAKTIPEKYPEVANSRTYRKMQALHQNVADFRLGKGLKATVDETRKVLEIAKASGAIKDFSVVPTAKGDRDNKGRLLTGSINVVDNNGNNLAFGRGESGDRITTSKDFVNAQLEAIDKEKDENKKGSKSLYERNQEMKKISAGVAKSPLKDAKPEEYSRQLEKSLGRSFTPAPGIGGIYQKGPDRVFVKPVIDYKSALAEQRATIIAREVHGLDVPEQTIKTMIDPTDPSGKRKIIILESPLNEMFDSKNMSNKFTPEEYIRQNVAAALRADKDLGRGNLGGNVLTDVGPAGVFATASHDPAKGDRDFAQTFDKKTKEYINNLPSMEDQARINLGIDDPLPGGGRKRFFAVQTKEIVEKMTADQYQKAMVDEIQRSLDKIRPVIKSFGITDPAEKAIYEAMEKRLEAGLTADWKAIHALHSSIAIRPDELLEDDKTDKLTKPKSVPLPSNVKSDAGSKDTRMIEKPKGKSVVQNPKKRKPRRVGKTVIHGEANAPEARSTVAGAMVDGAQNTVAKAKTVGELIGKSISQSAALASKNALYGAGPVDADAKSLRRQIEKRQRAEAKTQAKAAASQQALYGSGPINAVEKSKRRNAQLEMKRSQLAEKVAYKQSVITQNAAEEAKRRSLSGKLKTFAADREQKKQNRIAAGKGPGMGMTGGVMAASGVAMMASMVPGQVGEIANKIMMPLMGISMIMPMLQNKFTALAVGVGLVVAAYAYQRMAFDKAQDAALKLTEAMGSGSEAMKNLSTFAGKVSAGEIMDRRRKESFSPFQIKTGKTTFGESFVASEQGKSMIQNVGQTVRTSGKSAAKDQVVNQMATAVASGALSAKQARSIVANLAQEMGDYSFGIEVNGKLIELLGPNGENILKDPIGVRVKLLQDTREKMNLSTDATKRAAGFTGKDAVKSVGYTTAGAAAGGVAGAIAGGLIGAITGSLAGPAGTAAGTAIGVKIGTAVGTTLGATAGNLFGRKDRNKRIGEASGASVAMQKIALQQQQEIMDSVELEYQNKLAIARAAGDQLEVERLIKQNIEDRNKLLVENGALVTDVMNSYKDADGATQKALMTGADKAITKQYKGTALEDVAPLATTMINDSGVSQEKQYVLKMQLASGQIDPMQMIEIFDTFKDDKTSIDAVVNVMGKFGGKFANQMMGIVGMFKDPKQSADFVARISTKTPEAAQKELELFQRIAQSGTVVGADILLNYYNKNPLAAENLQKSLDKIDELKGKVTMEIAATVLGGNEMAALRADQAYFDSLPAEQQKVYLQNMKVMFSMEGDAALQEQYKNWAAEEGNQGKSFAQFVTAKTFQVTEASKDDTSKPKTKTTSGGGSKVESSPLDDLVKKLRDVRMNQIKVTEGWGASQKALNKLFGGSKTIQIFSGIENDMRKLGAGEDLIDLITGMDPKEYEKRKKSLFEFDAKGNIKKIKDNARSIGDAIASISLGEFVSEQERMSKQIGNQTTALTRLKAAGIEGSVALEAVADATFAASIANKKLSDKQVKKIADTWKEATKNKKNYAAVQTIEAEKTALEERAKLLTNITAIMGTLSEEERDAVLSNEALASALINLKNLKPGDKDFASFLDLIQRVLNKNRVELKINRLSLDGLQKTFDDGFNAAMEKADVDEKTLQLKFQADTKTLNEQIDLAQDVVNKLNYDIDDQEAILRGIEKQEEKINEKYDERIDALGEVEKANAAISAQQKGQLTLAEALTSGDIAAAARAAQDMRAQAAADAVTKEKEALEKSREYELSKVRQDGKSREDVEKEIERLQDLVFAQEEKIEKDQELIRLKEVQLRKDLIPIDERRTKWETLQNEIDIERTSNAKFMKLMADAEAVVEELKRRYKGLKVDTDPIIPVGAPAPVPGPTPTPTPEPVPGLTYCPSLGRNVPTSGFPGNCPGAGSSAPEDKTTPELTYCASLGRSVPSSGFPGNCPGAGSTDPVKKDSGTKTPTEGFTETPTTPYKPTWMDIDDPTARGHVKDMETNIAANIVRNSELFNREVNKLKIEDNAGTVAKNHYVDLNRLTDQMNLAKKYNTGPDYAKQQAEQLAANKAAAAKKAQDEANLKRFGGNAAAANAFGNWSMGGLIPKYFAVGGFAKGTDTVPAMLTPGEFIMSKYAVDSYGVDNMRKINNGDPLSGTVYNNTYTLTVNAKTDANPNDIAQAVMSTIKRVDDRRIRGVSLNGR